MKQHRFCSNVIFRTYRRIFTAMLLILSSISVLGQEINMYNTVEQTKMKLNIETVYKKRFWRASYQWMCTAVAMG
jgi:hypothetical protein